MVKKQHEGMVLPNLSQGVTSLGCFRLLNFVDVFG